MKKIYAKLIVIVLQLMLALSVVGVSSYAWLVLSANPALEGIQIAIGGGNTILVAPDLTGEMNGETYHYPGRFSDTLNFGSHANYDYLDQVGQLTPVSTADGINWFLPAYYDANDPEVQAGTAPAGTIKPVSNFVLDDQLAHANLDSSQSKKAAQGSYLYLDFWVTSPGADYTLRLSTGNDSGGSYAVGLMQAEESESGYTLVPKGDQAVSSVRVGILANPDRILDNNAMLLYQSSPTFNSQYSKLRGSYMEPGGGMVYSSGYRFTIYEPNGDFHPNTALAEDGTYVITQPVGLVGGVPAQVSVEDKVTVQKRSAWTMAPGGDETQLEQRFQTALLDPSYQGLTAAEITQQFYDKYMGGLLSPYISKGQFVKRTGNLYNAVASGVVTADFMGQQYTAGATDDVYIVKLEKNVPQRLRLFVWLEGQDVDCVNSASAASFTLKLELAGSNADVNMED